MIFERLAVGAQQLVLVNALEEPHQKVHVLHGKILIGGGFVERSNGARALLFIEVGEIQLFVKGVQKFFDRLVLCREPQTHFGAEESHGQELHLVGAGSALKGVGEAFPGAPRRLLRESEFSGFLCLVGIRIQVAGIVANEIDDVLVQIFRLCPFQPFIRGGAEIEDRPAIHLGRVEGVDLIVFVIGVDRRDHLSVGVQFEAPEFSAVGHLENPLPHFAARPVQFIEKQDAGSLRGLVHTMRGIEFCGLRFGVEVRDSEKVTFGHLRQTKIDALFSDPFGVLGDHFRLADSVKPYQHDRALGGVKHGEELLPGLLGTRRGGLGGFGLLGFFHFLGFAGLFHFRDPFCLSAISYDSQSHKTFL